MGREGTAITLVGYGEIPELNKIRALTKTRIEEMESTAPATYENRSKTYKAVCADCGKECEVPFKPDPNRPVYCRKCWEYRKPPIERI